MTADLVPVPASLLERLAAHGVDVGQALSRARISRSQIEARSSLTTREFFAFWHAVEKSGASRDLGLKLGVDSVMQQLNVASLAAIYAPNLGEALKRFARYKRLVCPEEIAIERAGGKARIQCRWILAVEPPPSLIVDGTFASILALARRGTGKQIYAQRIELTRERADEAMLRRHFECEVHFAAPHDLFIFDERELAEPFLTHNEDLIAVLLPGLEAALGDRQRKSTFADEVKAILSNHMRGERPTVHKIAREIGMSSRTLQRRLEETGTSYQELLDEVRRQFARHLLAETDLAAGEVAFLLGFEELNSFTRAFRIWEGTTPVQWRRANVSG